MGTLEMHFLPTPTVKEMTNRHRQSTELLARPQCLSLCVSFSFCLSCLSVSLSPPHRTFYSHNKGQFQPLGTCLYNITWIFKEGLPVSRNLDIMVGRLDSKASQQNCQVCLRWCLPTLHPQKGWCGGTKMARVVKVS